MWVCGEGGWERREEQEGGVRSKGRNSDKERRGVLVAREARIRGRSGGAAATPVCALRVAVPAAPPAQRICRAAPPEGDGRQVEEEQRGLQHAGEERGNGQGAERWKSDARCLHQRNGDSAARVSERIGLRHQTTTRGAYTRTHHFGKHSASSLTSAAV